VGQLWATRRREQPARLAAYHAAGRASVGYNRQERTRKLGGVMPTYFARYQAGDRERVWADLVALGVAIRQEPILSDAVEVARETMMRAGQNVDVLVARLHEIGYRFDFPDEIVMPPDAGLIDPVEWLDRHAGPLPLSLRAWYAVVGAVNLMGHHPKWDDRAADPLVVFSVELAAQEYQDWRLWRDEDGAAAGSFSITIAPGRLEKAGGEGGPLSRIQLPDIAADAPLIGDWDGTTFVDYLRACFRWGGFPGFARLTDPPRRDLAHLTRDLLPL
jgi:hypothetical protein